MCAGAVVVLNFLFIPCLCTSLFVSVGTPYTFRMKIKFYSSEPNSLREELTRLVLRYHFVVILNEYIIWRFV